MPRDGPSEWIVATEGAKTLPAVEILTGRGFITGKSGSGKSNSASVVAEQLLENNYNMLIIDPEGEYYGLKEKYELLHAGGDDFCDIQVTVDHADKLAEVALERNLPVILDVSDYLEEEEAKELIAETVKHLFKKEKDARKPFLLMVEEMQEYLPQKGGSDDLSKLLERVAKRGRKRGLGVLGMSQRPSSVDKDFITQCDWMVWHKLTWKTDLDVVREILGSEKTDNIENFEPGEAYLMTDWDDTVERVQFKRKTTHDAGATPGLESYDRPDLRSIGEELKQEIRTDVGVQKAPIQNGDSDGDTPKTAEMDFEQTVDEVDVDDKFSSPTADGIEDLDEDLDINELREALTRERQRNARLETEINELREILEDVKAEETNTPYAADGAAAKPVLDTKSGDPEQGKPTRPEVPAPPANRSGAAGVMVEFGQMILYLTRLLIFRIKKLFWRPSRDSHPPEQTN